MLASQNSTNEDNSPILTEEANAAIRSVRKGKPAGIGSIPAELIQHRGQVVTAFFTRICKKMWQTGEWPTPWRQSLIITLPKQRQSPTVSKLQNDQTSSQEYATRCGRPESGLHHGDNHSLSPSLNKGNLQQCQNYRTIRHLHKNMQKIWQIGEWPTPWRQSLIITLPKTGNLQQSQNYRTISLISHASKVMLKVILNRLKPQAEEISPKIRPVSAQIETPQNKYSI